MPKETIAEGKKHFSEVFRGKPKKKKKKKKSRARRDMEGKKASRSRSEFGRKITDAFNK